MTGCGAKGGRGGGLSAAFTIWNSGHAVGWGGDMGADQQVSSGLFDLI